MSKFRLSRDRYVEDLSVEKIEELLERRGLEEFKEFVRDRDIDGRKLLNVTEGIVKLWRPRINAKKFIMFVEELKTDPGIHLVSQESNNSLETNDTKIDVRIASEYDEESVFQHYKNVGMTRIREINFLTTVSSVEEILKKIVPAKSFLYRNQKAKTERINSSYVPMEGTSTKKSKTKLFRLSSYEYPFFDLSKFKYFTSETKTCSFNDRGYYSVQKENENTTDEKVYKIPIQRSRSRSLATADELYSIPERRIFEDHFYEDLCYSDVNSDSKARLRSYSTAKEFGSMLRSSYTSKIQGIFNSLKLPSIFKGGTEKKSKDIGSFEASSDMYDSIHLTGAGDEPSQIGRFEVSKVEVEDYLEPVHWSKDYCDIIYKDKEPSLVSAIRRMFEYNFRFRKDVADADRPDKSLSDSDKSGATSGAGANDTVQSSNETQKRDDADRKRRMADRPLPVPVEVEPYYRDVDRSEAEKLLAGCEDGAFVLRPSSQACHAYTLSVCCGGTVHNIGVRRRPDGQLALGFVRRGEKCHPHAAALLEYHQKRHLVLRPVGQGGTIGRVILTGPPDHYKVPVHPPKPVASDNII